MFNSFKKIILNAKWYIFIAIGIIVVFLIIANSLRIDIGNILFGIAAIGLVYVLYQYLEQKKQPQKTVNISLKAKLISPMIKLNRYKFQIIVEQEIKEKNETRIVKVEELDIKFRKSDHPDMYKWCFDYASDKINEHINSTKLQYPNAKVTYSPVPEISSVEKIQEK